MNNSESQPEIIKLKCNVNDIKNYDSDTAKILSQLPLVKPELKDILE